MAGENQSRQDRSKVLTVFQLASLATIVMCGTLMSEIGYKVIMGNIEFYQLVVAAAIVLCILEIMNNWASIKEYIEYYNRIALFVNDIVTIGLFYGQVYILTKLVESKHTLISIQRSLSFIVASFTLLYILYANWNRLIIKDERTPKDKINKVTRTIKMRRFQVMSGVVLFIVPILLKIACKGIELERILAIYSCLICVYIILGCVILFSARKFADVLKTIMEAPELGHF